MVKAGANHLVLGSSGLFRKGVEFPQAIIDLKEAIEISSRGHIIFHQHV